MTDNSDKYWCDKCKSWREQGCFSLGCPGIPTYWPPTEDLRVTKIKPDGTTQPVKCPQCGSDHVKTTLCEPIGLPECELAHCTDCCHSWVRCAE